MAPQSLRAIESARNEIQRNLETIANNISFSTTTNFIQVGTVERASELYLSVSTDGLISPFPRSNIIGYNLDNEGNFLSEYNNSGETSNALLSCLVPVNLTKRHSEFTITASMADDVLQPLTYSKESFTLKLNEDVRETVKEMIEDRIDTLVNGSAYRIKFKEEQKMILYSVFFLKAMLKIENLKEFEYLLDKFPIKDEFKLQFSNIYDMFHSLKNKSLQFLSLKKSYKINPDDKEFVILSDQEHIELLKAFNISIVQEMIEDLKNKYENLDTSKKASLSIMEFDIIAEDIRGLGELTSLKSLGEQMIRFLTESYINDGPASSLQFETSQAEAFYSQEDAFPLIESGGGNQYVE